jgi:hypothetical protein
MLRARSKHLSSGAAIVVCKKIFVLHPALCRPAGAHYCYVTLPSISTLGYQYFAPAALGRRLARFKQFS